jgi:hypothetical protein
MANETSEVVTSWTLLRGRRVPGSAARADRQRGQLEGDQPGGQVASAGDPTARSPRGAGDGDGGPAGLVGALGRPPGSRVTAAASRAAAQGVVDSAVAE